MTEPVGPSTHVEPDLARKSRLARNGGPKAIKSPLPPMYPGGMRIGAEEEEAVLDVLRSKRLFRYYGPYSGASRVDEFEKAFAADMNTDHAVAVSSGTAALVCGLAALGLGPGDEVIIPAYTWIASAGAAMAVGAVPILAEIDESLTLDVADVESKINSRTKAIMPVHMRGAPCQMQRIAELAQSRGLKVLEDVAQAIGGSFRGQRLGSIGDVGAFSFQFNKIITCGEGGAAITSDAEIYQRIVMYHDVAGGMPNRIPSDKILNGLNFRMSELHGAIMLVQLRRLDGLLADLRQRKNTLKCAIQDVAKRKGVSFRALNDADGDTATSLVFFAPNEIRAFRIAEALNAEGVNASLLYQPGRVDYHVYAHWIPVMEKRTWSENGGPWRWHGRDVEYSRDMCPRSLDLLGRAVHIDISPDMNAVNVEELADAVLKVLDALL
ncbi:DegT/DnrJ/EryC1/StrS family aminotransferase [Rhodoplanes sp. Z2-YC6860]|uniref:DegT/DnrJ/EryC1/StrS family aminotransferase n=1 Tax=Rhodoplanes sp. Z2-YC6860 TaxID=674703 RepID=UPI00078D0A2B|nr:DegT/DnrJ/EryC1/StrS family aminotransferase [Rhodoplanes sp. Z2-YC6860]AMN43642.1 glutamine--scyllo-inositol transaminase [Rhodoplanes sp. Z2-YC6860]